MAVSSLDQVAEDEEVDIEWRAFELRPEGQSGRSSQEEERYRKMIEQKWPDTIEMGRQYGVEMKTHKWGVNTRPAHEGAKYAEANGAGDAYHWAVFKAYFEDGRDLGDIDVLVDIASDIGLDAEAFREAVESNRYRDEVLAEEQWAMQSGIRGVPAFIFEEKYLLTGVRPSDQLARVMQQIRAETGET